VCLLGGAPGAVGCDLELVEPRSAAFVRHFFTSTEQQAIHDDLTANLLWSAKESVLKVLRTGLRRDTRTVEVVAEPGGAEWTSLTACTIEGTIYPGWWRRIGDFILTVAADHPAPAPKPLEQPSTLASATPRHSWLAQPVTRPSCGQVMPSVVGAGRPEFGRAPGPAR
jgi:4'-phosphopantetheinyl transferase